jgi:hypothetical protein
MSHSGMTWGKILGGHLGWIDLLVFGILGMLHVAAWWKLAPQPTDDPARSGATTLVMTASGAGLASVGILLPLSFVALQATTSSPYVIRESVSFSVLVADFWFALSLTMGLLATYFLAFKPTRHPFTMRRVGIPLGIQFLAMLMGIARMFAAMVVLVGGG